MVRISDLIQQGRACTVERLARELGVNNKTIQRDVKKMRLKEGIKIKWDAGEGCYKLLEPVHKLSRVILKGEDAVTSLLIACSVLRDFRYTPLSSEMEELTKALTSNLPSKTAHYELIPQKYSFVHSQMASVNPKIWKIVVHTLNVNHELKITYKKPNDEPEARIIQPLHLRGYKGGWYIVAYCKMRGKQRTFSMSRILDAEDTGDEISAEAATFDPDQYFTCKSEIFRTEGPETCAVRFSPEVAVRVCEVTWFENQQIKANKDGSVTMTFDAADITSATRFVIEWGGEAKALRPRALVRNVRESISALAKAHRMAT